MLYLYCEAVMFPQTSPGSSVDMHWLLLILYKHWVSLGRLDQWFL